MLARIIAFSAAVLLLGAAVPGKSLTGFELSSFEGRELLVIRTSGDVPVPSTFSRDKQRATVSFRLAAGAFPAQHDADMLRGELIREVAAEQLGAEVEFVVRMAAPELADPAYFRFSSPGRHLVVFEVFPLDDARSTAAPLRELDGWLSEAQAPAAPAAQRPAGAAAGKPGDEAVAPGASSAGKVSFASASGIPSLDLSGSDPQRVLGLAAALGLLDLRGEAAIDTERLGGVSVKPSGQSLMGWTDKTPPGEIYLAGSPEQIAKFLQLGDPRFIGGQPTLQQEWAKARPQASTNPVLGGSSAATRSRIKDDPHGGLFYSNYQPGGLRLSDIRVNLDASAGLNLYDVLNYLSEVSGISLVIDPYTFDEPTGSRRTPLAPETTASGTGEAGFRQAGLFQPGTMGSGTVRGNFVNVPFDEFLQTILATHELAYVVQGGGGSSDSGYGGAGRGPGPGTQRRDPYEKPLILVTSKQRLEYELSGTNDIALNQFHYADPVQVAEILQQFGMVADINSGWYVYRGSGGNGNLGGGGGGLGGGGGIGGGGNSRPLLRGTAPAVVVYRGSGRQPVEAAVGAALAAGQSVVHIKLGSERDGQLVTLFSQGRKTR